ncbi:MAG: type II secretion system protein N [Nevskia sp.]|nr:type II secretion system protein N [Nevskia sp.]
MKTRTLVVVGVLVLIWSLLMHAPAANLYAWFAPKNSPVELYGLDGDIARGKVQTVSLGGHPLLQSLRWRFQPWWLPLLRLSFAVEGGQDLNLDGRVALGPAGGVDVSGAHAGGGVKAMLGLAGIPFVPVDGQVRLNLDSLKLRKGFPSSAAGTLEVHGLAWTLVKDPQPLGDFKATITTERPTTGTSGGNTIKAVIEPIAGPVDASGEVHLLADRSYDYDLQLKARDSSNATLNNMMQSLGQPDTRGYYHLRNRGTLAGAPPR